MRPPPAGTAPSPSCAWTGATLRAGETLSLELKNLCVWAKTNGGMGTFYRSKHELVFVFKVGKAPHTNTFGLGDTGRYRTNVWEYAGVNSLGASRDEELAMHPDRQTGRSRRRCHQGLLEARRDRARPVRRLWHHPDRGREDRPPR